MLGPLLLAFVSAASTAEAPSDADLVHFNARVALREGRSREVLKLWLLRNTIQSHTGALPAADADFLSLTWVALGDLGLCQDGLHLDAPGPGLWPIAMHNWFLRNMRASEPADPPKPFDGFRLGQQHRFVSLEDVLDAEELTSVRFHRTRCARLDAILDGAGRAGGDDPRERDVQVRALTYLLKASLRSMHPALVQNRSVVEARLLDLRLKDVEVEGEAARRADRAKARAIEKLGVESPGPDDPARRPAIRRALAVTTTWSAEEWLALERARRLFLYDWLRRSGLAADTQPGLRLEVVDALVARRDGQEIGAWIAFAGDGQDDKAAFWRGARGKRLLGMDAESGFRERGAIALHRGVDFVARGALGDALRAFALALHHAPESKDSEAVRRLGLRWLAYVAGRYEVTETLLATLVELVPRGDLSVVLESLIWDAAFAADEPSFTRAVAALQGRGAVRRRALRLVPLARGDAGAFVNALAADMEASPRAVLRFVRRLLDRLESQDGDVRAEHRPTLRALRDLLDEHGTAAGVSGSLGRKADGLRGEVAAILVGLATLAVDAPRERARALDPTAKVFAGSIRLAPSDPLPWPFARPVVRAPSVFQPIRVTPVEPPGPELVLGWRLGQ